MTSASAETSPNDLAEMSTAQPAVGSIEEARAAMTGLLMRQAQHGILFGKRMERAIAETAAAKPDARPALIARNKRIGHLRWMAGRMLEHALKLNEPFRALVAIRAAAPSTAIAETVERALCEIGDMALAVGVYAAWTHAAAEDPPRTVYEGRGDFADVYGHIRAIRVPTGLPTTAGSADPQQADVRRDVAELLRLVGNQCALLASFVTVDREWVAQERFAHEQPTGIEPGLRRIRRPATATERTLKRRFLLKHGITQVALNVSTHAAEILVKAGYLRPDHSKAELELAAQEFFARQIMRAEEETD